MKKLIINNKFLIDNKIDFGIQYESTKTRNLKNILLQSREIYELCLYTCKGNIDDTKDLYSLLTKGYDDNLNDKAVMKIKLNDGEDVLLRILNYERYKDSELKIIKDKLYHDYNHYNYEEIKQKINMAETKLREYAEKEIEELNKSKERNKYKYSFFWSKIKCFYQEILKKNKIKFFLKKIKKAGLLFNREESRKLNIIKMREYLKKKKDNVLIQDYLIYNLEKYKKSPCFYENVENITEEIRLFLGKEKIHFDAKTKIYFLTFEDLIIYTKIMRKHQDKDEFCPGDCFANASVLQILNLHPSNSGIAGKTIVFSILIKDDDDKGYDNEIEIIEKYFIN